MASPEQFDSIWNDDMSWGSQQLETDPKSLVVLPLLPEQQESNPQPEQSWDSKDWS